MTAYAGFRDLVEYIDQRCQREGITPTELARKCQWPPNYISDIRRRVFSPSRPRAEKLARFFGDEPRLVRILAGLEAPPSLVMDKDIAEIVDLCRPLSKDKRQQVIRFLQFLNTK